MARWFRSSREAWKRHHNDNHHNVSIVVHLVLDGTNYPVKAFFHKEEAEKYVEWTKDRTLTVMAVVVRHY